MTPLEHFKAICETIAVLHPDMPMSEALPLALRVEQESKARGVPQNMDELIALGRSTPDVMDNIEHRKINAIKALRVAVHERADAAGLVENPALGGLKACKEAVEAIAAGRVT